MGSMTKGRLKWRWRAAWLGVFALLVQVFVPLAQADSQTAEEALLKDLGLVCSMYGTPIPLPKDDNNRQSVQAFFCPICQVHAFAYLATEGLSVSAPVRMVFSGEKPPHQTLNAVWLGFFLLTRGPPQAA